MKISRGNVSAFQLCFILHLQQTGSDHECYCSSFDTFTTVPPDGCNHLTSKMLQVGFVSDESFQWNFGVYIYMELQLWILPLICSLLAFYKQSSLEERGTLFYLSLYNSFFWNRCDNSCWYKYVVLCNRCICPVLFLALPKDCFADFFYHLWVLVLLPEST